MPFGRRCESDDLAVAEVTPVGVHTFGKPHALTRIARDAPVLHRRTKHLTEDAEGVFDDRRTRPSATIAAIQARIAAVRTSMTNVSPHFGSTRLLHALRREAAVFAEMCAWAGNHEWYTSATVTRPADGAT